jgi:hypothetical protein
MHGHMNVKSSALLLLQFYEHEILLLQLTSISVLKEE